MQEYMFSYMKRGIQEVPILRIKSAIESETNLTIGTHQHIAIKQPDIIYEYDFVVKNRIKEETDTEGNHYAWYQLDYLSKSVDRTPSAKSVAEQNAANIDYLSMMSGIDLPDEEEEEINEQEI